MRLDGSCHCGAVRFSLDAAHPYPFALCYCSICRKTAGAGGYAINLGGDAASLTIKGGEHICVYRAHITGGAGEPELSPLERRFCGRCGSMLWCWDPRWPDLVHPFASAIGHHAASTARADAPDAWLEGTLGRSTHCANRQGVHRVSRRVTGAVARAPWLGHRGLTRG